MSQIFINSLISSWKTPDVKDLLQKKLILLKENNFHAATVSYLNFIKYSYNKSLDVSHNQIDLLLFFTLKKLSG